MTRSVRDAALMFSALARYDLRDPFCIPDDPRDWCEGIEDGVGGLRVGVLRRPGFDAPVDADGIAAVERAATILTDAGATVDEVAPDLPDTSAVFARVWGAALARLVAVLPEDRRALLDPGILEVADRLGGMTAVAFMDAEAMRAMAGHAMARLHQRIDLLLCPTVPAGPPPADAPTRRSGAGAVARMGAVDLHLQPDAPAGDRHAARLRRVRPATQRAACRRAVSRRPGAARRARARAGRAGGDGGAGVRSCASPVGYLLSIQSKRGRCHVGHSA